MLWDCNGRCDIVPVHPHLQRALKGGLRERRSRVALDDDVVAARGRGISRGQGSNQSRHRVVGLGRRRCHRASFVHAVETHVARQALVVGSIGGEHCHGHLAPGVLRRRQCDRRNGRRHRLSQRHWIAFDPQARAGRMQRRAGRLRARARRDHKRAIRARAGAEGGFNCQVYGGGFVCAQRVFGFYRAGCRCRDRFT